MSNPTASASSYAFAEPRAQRARDRAVHQFGELIRARRRMWARGSGLSQKALAELLGVSRRTVAAMESGDPSVSLETWLRAWQVLGLLPNVTAAAAPDHELAIAAAAAIAASAAARPGRTPPDEASAFPAPRRRPTL